MSRMVYRGGQGTMGTIPGGPLGKAKFALSSGRPDEAERICRKRLERRPDETSTRLLLAQALVQMQQPVEAIAEVRRVIREQPANVDAHLVLSAALTQHPGIRGIPAEAEQAARRAVQLQPKLARAHVQLAEVLAANRNYKGARAEADEAVRLEPRLAGAHLMRAVVLLSDKDPAGAVQSSDSALRFDRSLVQAEFIKASALVSLKRYDEALVSLDTLDRQNPLLLGNNGRVLRGRIYFKQRQFGLSYAQFRSVQQMTPRLRFLAPTLASINMVLTGFFGDNAQFAWIFLIVAVIVAILAGLSFIPVAGPWIVATLVLALVGVSAFAYVRQTQGAFLPREMTAKVTAIGATVAVIIVAFALVLGAAYGITHGILGKTVWWGVWTYGIAGSISLVLGAATLWVWPRLLAGRSKPAKTVG